MAKGQESKQVIISQLLEQFEGSFLYNDGKEVRIPMTEDGAEVQIKVTLTCAKTNVEPGSDSVLPGEVIKKTLTSTQSSTKDSIGEEAIPSEDELAAMNDLMKALNL